LFGASRFLWPAHNLALLVVIGAFFGQGAVGDYTYALAICTPFYFLVSFTFSYLFLVDTRRNKYRIELLFLRISSVLASMPLGPFALAFLPSAQGYAVIALWILKLGEVLFEPIPIYVGTDTSREGRGRRLFICDVSRVLLAQALMWFCVLVVKGGMIALLLVMGLSNLVLSLWFLVSVPDWIGRGIRIRRVCATARRLFRYCLPMTLSAVLLALLISLPRLLSDSSLEEHERAIFGAAQVIGSGMAMLFNAMWLYELHKVQRSIQNNDLAGAAKINATLSLLFLAALSAGSLVVFAAEPVILSVLNIQAVHPVLFPALIFLLGFQHCVSVHRDLLKLTGQVWIEVKVLAVTLGIAALVYELSVTVIDSAWPTSVALFCLASALTQVLLSYLWMRRSLKNPRVA